MTWVDPRTGFRYAREPKRLVFPVEAEMPETKRHLEMRTALYEVLKIRFAKEAWIGSEQFVYWDPLDPSACVAPDAFVRLGGPDDSFDCWKVWERGAPELAVEIVNDSDASPSETVKKFLGYNRLGVKEYVRFDPDGASLRIWDRSGAGLVERTIEPGSAPACVPLGLFWQVTESAPGEWSLRLSVDPAGKDLLLTHAELREQSEAQGRAAAERIRELEAELARRG